MRRRAPVSLAFLCLGLSACGGGGHASALRHQQPPVHKPKPITAVDVYSSLPQQGPHRAAASAIEKGIMLALEEAHNQEAGVLKINYRALDDATRARQRLEHPENAGQRDARSAGPEGRLLHR